MAKFASYPEQRFQNTQRFLARDQGGTGQVVRVSGQEILDAAVAAIEATGEIMQSRDTEAELLATDYQSGVYVVTGGRSTLFDGDAGIYRVSDPGSGGSPMANGNEAVLLFIQSSEDARDYGIGANAVAAPNDNLDDIVKGGIYRIGPSTTNGPADAPAGSTCVHRNFDDTTASEDWQQDVISRDGSRRWQRGNVNGSISAWKSLTSSRNRSYDYNGADPDNIVLTSKPFDTPESSLQAGDVIRFFATVANTGATTINVDGLGATACVTVTGVALPADYIRTDVDTEAVYDGTNWVVSRKVEHGSNSNGKFTLLEDGTLNCWHELAGPSQTFSEGGIIFSTNTLWTFPISPVNSDYSLSGSADVATVWIGFGDRTLNSVNIRSIKGASGTAVTLHPKLTGEWY
ncbi:MAG: hypothetical protein HRU12_13645 [Phaeodactylibacter sp.]|nr:hypothetical protein [Phaeodactylibacter sp.]